MNRQASGISERGPVRDHDWQWLNERATRRTTPAGECVRCHHRHDDVCHAAMDADGNPGLCGCPPPCDVCDGSGLLPVPVSHYEDGDVECSYCDGTGVGE